MATKEKDPFEGGEVLPGAEHLGRAITDAAGQPSGSPANWENERGVPAFPELNEDDAARAVGAITEMFAKQPKRRTLDDTGITGIDADTE